jgi:hypothetical protein
MKHLSRRAGLLCPRWLVLTSCLVGLTATAITLAQDKLERPKPDENTRFESFRSGSAPVVIENDKAATAQNQQIIDRYARWYTLRLNEAPKDAMSSLVQDAMRRTLMPAPSYADLKLEQRQFVDEFGKAMVNHLTGLVLNNPNKPWVRVNAARMASEVGKMGYDGTAELCIKILEKEDESDGVKLWALKGLHNLFAIVPDPKVAPEKTVFQKKNAGVLSPLERKSILALINFIQRKVQFPEDLNPKQRAEAEDAVRYVRREAVRALANVRVQSVKSNLNEVESRPALELLKIARRDLPEPSPSAAEMTEAIIGFCHLKPDRDRDLQIDYAAYHIGKSIYEVVQFRVQNPFDTSIPWKATANRLIDALGTWRKNADDMKLQDAKLIKDLIDKCEAQALKPIESGVQGNPPDILPLTTWLGANQPKSVSLFKSDKATVVKTKE